MLYTYAVYRYLHEFHAIYRQTTQDFHKSDPICLERETWVHARMSDSKYFLLWPKLRFIVSYLLFSSRKWRIFWRLWCKRCLWMFASCGGRKEIAIDKCEAYAFSLLRIYVDNWDWDKAPKACRKGTEIKVPKYIFVRKRKLSMIFT